MMLSSSVAAAAPRAIVRSQFEKSRSQFSTPKAPIAGARRSQSVTTTAVQTPPAPPKPRMVYLSRDSQRFDKLQAALASEIDTPQGLSAKTQIAMAKDLIMSGCGVENPDVLAEDFVYETPWGTPLNKEDYVKVFQKIDMDGAFPGRSYNARGFRVQWDSKVREHSYKVFCTVQFKGTHTGVLNFGRPIPPTGKAVVGALEVMSFTFNTAGLCSRITAEYVTDKSVGNTGGWGGMYGIMHAIDKPIPEPWTIGGKLCAAFPPLLGFTSTMGLWILNGVLLGAAVTGGTKAPPSKPPPAAAAKAAAPKPCCAKPATEAAAPAAAAPAAAASTTTTTTTTPAAPVAAEAPAAAAPASTPAPAATTTSSTSSSSK